MQIVIQCDCREGKLKWPPGFDCVSLSSGDFGGGAVLPSSWVPVSLSSSRAAARPLSIAASFNSNSRSPSSVFVARSSDTDSSNSLSIPSDIFSRRADSLPSANQSLPEDDGGGGSAVSPTGWPPPRDRFSEITLDIDCLDSGCLLFATMRAANTESIVGVLQNMACSTEPCGGGGGGKQRTLFLVYCKVMQSLICHLKKIKNKSIYLL